MRQLFKFVCEMKKRTKTEQIESFKNILQNIIKKYK